MASSTMERTAQQKFEQWLAENPSCTLAQAVRMGKKLDFLVLYNTNPLNVNNEFVWRLNSYAKWRGVRAPVSLEKFVKDMDVKGALRGKHYIVSFEDLYEFMGKHPPFGAEQPEVVTPTTTAGEEDADDEAVGEGEELGEELPEPENADVEQAAAQAELEELVEREVEKMAAKAEAVAEEEAAKAAEAKKTKPTPKKKVCVFPGFHPSDPMVIILVL